MYLIRLNITPTTTVDLFLLNNKQLNPSSTTTTKTTNSSTTITSNTILELVSIMSMNKM